MSEPRPMTDAELANLLKRAYSLAEDGESSSGLAICTSLVEDPTTTLEGLRGRASIHEIAGNFDEAIADLEAIVASSVYEPADMYSLGLLYLQLDCPADAEKVLAKGIQVCLDENFDYYLNSCRLLRGESLLRLRKAPAALSELELLPAGYSVWVYGRGNRVKEAMIAEARRALA
jgi:tetratricopeptide (TPR) repeat protein